MQYHILINFCYNSPCVMHWQIVTLFNLLWIIALYQIIMARGSIQREDFLVLQKKMTNIWREETLSISYLLRSVVNFNFEFSCCGSGNKECYQYTIKRSIRHIGELYCSGGLLLFVSAEEIWLVFVIGILWYPPMKCMAYPPYFAVIILSQ